MSKKTKKAKRYSVQWFINKFKAIPRNRWTTGALKRDDGAKCLLGHCGVQRDYNPTRQAILLHRILFPKAPRYLNSDLYDVNDRVADPKAAVIRRLKTKAKKAA